MAENGQFRKSFVKRSVIKIYMVKNQKYMTVYIHELGQSNHGCTWIDVETDQTIIKMITLVYEHIDKYIQSTVRNQFQSDR